MKKLILTLALFSLPAIQAMNSPAIELNERKDDEFLGFESPLQDAQEELISAEQAMAMFKEKRYPFQEAVADATPLAQVIVRLITQYSQQDYAEDSCDAYINETPLYQFARNDHLFNMYERRDIKRFFFEQLEAALTMEQERLGNSLGIPLTNALMIGDAVWQKQLKSRPFSPFPTGSNRVFSPYKNKIIVLFSGRAVPDSSSSVAFCMVYDIEKNAILNFLPLSGVRTEVGSNCVLRLHPLKNGSFEIEADLYYNPDNRNGFRRTYVYDPNNDCFSMKVDMRDSEPLYYEYDGDQSWVKVDSSQF
jgi:hypothetical protein